MSLRSAGTGSTLSYKSQLSQSTLSKRNSNNGEKLPKVTVVTSNHIHYDPPGRINLKYIQLKISQLYYDSEVRTATAYSYIIRVECNDPDNVWIIRRNVADFKFLDHILHGGCRATSSSRDWGLPNLHPPDVLDKCRNSYSMVYLQYSNYIDRLNKFLRKSPPENGNLLMLNYFNCSLLLSWFELGTDGHHKVHSLLGPQTFSNFGARNAIAKSRFPKQGIGDLTIEVNDIVTVVEAPVLADSVWSRGKSDKTFQNGFFPSRCVEDFQFNNTEKPNLASCPGLRNLVQEEEKIAYQAGEETSVKLLAGRSPHSSQRKEPSHLPTGEVNPDFPCIFGRSLQTAMKWNYALRKKDAKRDKEHRNSELSKLYTSQNCEESLEHVPWVIQSMIEHVHKYGGVDGIYRLNGSSSEIQDLVYLLDSGNIDMDWLSFDIHSVSSLLKQYFRDLSVSLIPADSYAAFILPLVSKPDLLKEQYKLNDVNVNSKESLMIALGEITEQLYILPCTYYHTLKLLMLHLNSLVSEVEVTNMNLYNLAIMWAPNLLFDPLEKNCQDYIEIAKKAKETAARKGKLMEIMIAYAGNLFSDKLTKSALRYINEIGCSDKLRGKTRHENEDFETYTLLDLDKSNNCLRGSSSLKERANKDKFTFMLHIQKLFPKTEKLRVVPKKQRSTSLINPSGDCNMKRDSYSIESGMYSFIPASASTKDLREHPATPDSLDEERRFNNHGYLSFESLEQSECGSEDSTIAGLSPKNGASRHTDLQHSTSTIRDDPETHVYSQIHKRKTGLSRTTEGFKTAKAYSVETYDDDGDDVFESFFPRSTCPNSLRLQSNGSSSSNSVTREDAIPFIDSCSPTPATSTPSMYKHGRHDFNKSKDSSIDMIDKDFEPLSSALKSPRVVPRQPTTGYGYKYNAGCNLDNFSTDKAYVAPPTSNAAYQRYFNKSKSGGQHGPKSVTPMRTSSRPCNTENAANSISRRRPVQKASPLLYRQSPITSHPIVSPERLKAAGEGSAAGELHKNLKGNWGTAYSFDSGVENNGSSNDDLLSNT